MATSYGYRPATYGRYGSKTNPARGGIADQLAASPLQGGSPLSSTSGNAGYQGFQMLNQPRAKAAAPAPAAAPATPQVARPQQPQAAPTPGAYDVNTDPVLMQIQALAGRSDEDAQAAALKQRQNLLLGYGDPNLARAVLGDENYAQAAGQNPTSILAQLATQRGRLAHDLTEALNQQNLFYSGYRVNQEQQAAQDYLGEIARQAGLVNQGLDTIAGNLAGALAQNQAQRTSGLNDAYQRAIEAAMNGYAPAGGEAGGGGIADALGGGVPDARSTGLGAGLPYTADDPLVALMLASALRTRPVAI